MHVMGTFDTKTIWWNGVFRNLQIKHARCKGAKNDVRNNSALPHDFSDIQTSEKRQIFVSLPPSLTIFRTHPKKNWVPKHSLKLQTKTPGFPNTI